MLKEKAELAEQIANLSEQVGADEAKLLEATEKATAAQKQLATKEGEFIALQAEWEDTQRALTEKHGTVLQKHAQKKQALHAANEEAAKHAVRADELGARLAGLERTVKVLEGQKEEDAQKYKELVAEVEQRQRTLDAHSTRGLSKDKEWQSQQETLRKEAEQREATLLRKQGELQSALSEAEAELKRLREAAGGASSDAQLRMLQRMDRENKAYNASVVQKTVEVLGSIIERTSSTASPWAVLPAATDGAYRAGAHFEALSRAHASRYCSSLCAAISPALLHAAARSRSPSAISPGWRAARTGTVRRRSSGPLQWNAAGLEGSGARHEELDATQLTHADILNRVCAQLDLSHPKELIPFSIRVSNLLAFGNKLQAFVHEVRMMAAIAGCAYSARG